MFVTDSFHASNHYCDLCKIFPEEYFIRDVTSINYFTKNTA